MEVFLYVIETLSKNDIMFFFSFNEVASFASPTCPKNHSVIFGSTYNSAPSPDNLMFKKKWLLAGFAT